MNILLFLLLVISIITNIVLILLYKKSNRIKQGATAEIDLFLSSIEGEVKRFKKKYIEENKT